MDETSKQIEEYLKKYPHSSMGSIERRRRWLEKRVRDDEQKRKVRAEELLDKKYGKTVTFESPHDNNDDDDDSIFSGEEDYDPYLDEPDYHREERLDDMWDELHDPYWRQNS